MSTVRLGAGSALAEPLADARRQPLSGAMDDAVTCCASAERQAFGDELRKLRLARIPDAVAQGAPVTLAGLVAEVVGADDTVDANRRLPGPVVEVRVLPFDGAGSATLASTATTAVVRLLEATPAEAMRAVSEAAARAVREARAATAGARALTSPCVTVVLPDVFAAFASPRPHLPLSATLLINWACDVAVTLQSLAPAGSSAPPMWVVIEGPPTLTAHDDVYGHLLERAPVSAVAFTGVGGTTAGDPVAAEAVFDVADVAVTAQTTVHDWAADVASEQHTAIALELDDDSDDDTSAASGGAVPVVVVIAQDAAAAEVARHAALSRYVAEPMVALTFDGTPSREGGAATFDSRVPLVVVAALDDVRERALTALPAWLSTALPKGSVPHLACVVHCGADSEGAALSDAMCKHDALTVAGALAPLDGSRPSLHIAPRCRASPGDFVTVTIDGAEWTVAKYVTCDPPIARCEFGATDGSPATDFTQVVHVEGLEARSVVLVAEALMEACVGASTAIAAAFADDATAGKARHRSVSVDLPRLAEDAVPGLPPLAAASATSTGPTMLNVALRLLTLSEAIAGAPSSVSEFVATALARACAPSCGLWASRLFLAAAACRAAPPAVILGLGARLVGDRARASHATHAERARDAAAPRRLAITPMQFSSAVAAGLDVQRWEVTNTAAAEDDDTAAETTAAKADSDDEGTAEEPAVRAPAAGSAAREERLCLGHAAALWASYPCVAVMPSGDLDASLTRCALGVDSDAPVDDASYPLHPRSHLAFAAPRARRDAVRDPRAQGPVASTCRGWAPLAQLTLHSGASGRVLTLEAEAELAAGPAKPTAVIEDGAAAKDAERAAQRGTRTFPSLMEVHAGCAIALDASFSSALEGAVPPLLLPTDSTAPLVIAKTTFRTFVINAAVLACDAARSGSRVAVPQLPRSAVDLPLWRALTCAEVPVDATRGVGRWLDSAAKGLPQTNARRYDTVADNRGGSTADVVASIAKIEQQPAAKASRAEGGSGVAANGGGSAEFTGTLPPPPERKFIEDSAKKLVAKGRAAAEAKVKAVPAFAFVNAGHAFHPFYLHVVAQLEAAKLQ